MVKRKEKGDFLWPFFVFPGFGLNQRYLAVFFVFFACKMKVNGQGSAIFFVDCAQNINAMVY